jgi:hypothetical protein
MVLTGLRAEVSADYEELEYYRYAYGHEPGRKGDRTSRRAATGSGLSGLLGRLFKRS